MQTPAALGKRTQDLIFTLYGDYLLQRGGSAWTGSLIRLLGTLGASEQAVRSTVSRMARKGWLKSERHGRNSRYTLTARAIALLTEGSRKIYSPPQNGWDGHWYLVTYAFSDDMGPTRHRLRKQLLWLGFGQLANGSLISPHNLCAEVEALLDELDAREHVDIFRADRLHLTDGESLARRCWDLEALNASYRQFIQTYQPQYERDCVAEAQSGALEPENAFERRFWLVHDYRAFPFQDPYLPPDLLPDTWLGYSAFDLFQTYHALLGEKANAYVDEVLAGAP